MVQVKNEMKTQRIDLGIDNEWLPEVRAAIIDLIQNYDYENLGHCAKDIMYWAGNLLKLIKDDPDSKGKTLFLEVESHGSGNISYENLVEIREALFDLLKNSFSLERNTTYYAVELIEGLIKY
ncbi:hypothetical protein [uncultured Sunxiuqinia sp.]|uniref:hypothetical protein n=1 Tax=uncultured Sunxiuqinia sp. TaxID=1573825 RepID=UPI002AA9274F|nr:hypothetical protein [uncultured Sunxiuqinia sp.]